MKENKFIKIELLFSLFCWITIITQFVVMIENSVASLTETTIRFFTFFTILSNILVAVVFTAILAQPKGKFSFFFKSNKSISYSGLYFCCWNCLQLNFEIFMATERNSANCR
jgi:hypothetical protein